jgi:pyruvate dehydrogenase E2 component (dihydrolipoamide acetyltransferase)
MRIEIRVPQIGEAVSELTLVQWLKQAGDAVRKGDVLFEVDADKAIVEVEAYADGYLAEILIPAGSSIMPQDVVAYIETSETSTAQTPPPPPAVEPAAPDVPRPDNGRRVTPVAQRVARDLGVNLDEVTGSSPQGRITAGDVRQFAQDGAARPAGQQPALINASPKARARARELHVDLRALTGTGAAGMIRVRDVEAAAGAVPQPAPAQSPAQAGGARPLSRLRQTIAMRTQESKREVPHFYLMVDADMTAANDLRRYCQQMLGWPHPPTYTALLIRACALALADVPQANQRFNEGGLISHEAIHIGVAVNTDDGLVVPVIHHADQLSLRAVGDALQGAASRAREGRLKPEDLGQKSMVISNLGMYAVDRFIAIIDMPDPMILAVGRVADRVVPVAGQPVIRPMGTLSLSVDHRVMDGVLGAQFLECVKTRLENPYEVLGQS